MAAPVLQSASVQSVMTTTAAANMTGVTLSASGNNRVLFIACMSGDMNSTTKTVSTVVVDSAGVNSTLANGKVVRVGTAQVAKEGIVYCLVDIFICLEANLPSGAGNINIDTTMSGAPDNNLWAAFEITGVLKQATDNVVKSVVLPDVSNFTDMINTITPNDPDCLIINLVSLNSSGFVDASSTDTNVVVLSPFTPNGSIITQFTQVGSPAAKNMVIQNSDISDRHANTTVSFSGVAGGGGGSFKSYFDIGVNNLLH